MISKGMTSVITPIEFGGVAGFEWRTTFVFVAEDGDENYAHDVAERIQETVRQALEAERDGG
jgi:hypothetical protein